MYVQCTCSWEVTISGGLTPVFCLYNGCYSVILSKCLQEMPPMGVFFVSVISSGLVFFKIPLIHPKDKWCLISETMSAFQRV